MMRKSFLKLHHIFAFAVRSRVRATSQSRPRKTTQNTRSSPKKGSSSLDGERSSTTCKLSLISNSFRWSLEQTTVQEYYIREDSSSDLRVCQSLSLIRKWPWHSSYSTQRGAGKAFPQGVVVRPAMPNGLYKFGTGYDIFGYSDERLTPTDQE